MVQNLAEAVRWWRKAAGQGDASAQVLLGSAYQNSEGVVQDFAEAARWRRKAADQGNVLARGLLAITYDVGWGVPRSEVEAYFWASLAATLVTNDPDLKQALTTKNAEMRDEIDAKLPRSQLLATQKRCRQWLEAFKRRRRATYQVRPNDLGADHVTASHVQATRLEKSGGKIGK